jgi:hypothetical protein
MSRPSTFLIQATEKNVDHRDKPGDDDWLRPSLNNKEKQQ